MYNLAKINYDYDKITLTEDAVKVKSIMAVPICQKILNLFYKHCEDNNIEPGFSSDVKNILKVAVDLTNIIKTICQDNKITTVGSGFSRFAIKLGNYIVKFDWNMYLSSDYGSTKEVLTMNNMINAFEETQWILVPILSHFNFTAKYQGHNIQLSAIVVPICEKLKQETPLQKMIVTLIKSVFTDAHGGNIMTLNNMPVMIDVGHEDQKSIKKLKSNYEIFWHIRKKYTKEWKKFQENQMSLWSTFFLGNIHRNLKIINKMAKERYDTLPEITKSNFKTKEEWANYWSDFS